MRKKINAFTMVEVIVVIVAVAIIAAFSIPNYARAIHKADERNMMSNLRSLRATVVLYTRGGGVIGNWNSLSAVNANLGASIVDPKATYACRDAGGATNQCTATHPAGWAIQFHEEHSSGLLHCSAGVCPTCPNQPGNCG